MIQLEPTNRGFLRGEFLDANGQRCTIQQSSAFSVGGAEGAFLWLGVHQAEVKQFTPGQPWRDFPLPENAEMFSRMHLSQEHVRFLLPLLVHFAETGELPEPEEAAKE